MRDYKFRCWHEGAREMLYDEKPGDCLVWKSQGQPVIIMQSTGLRDKNGKEIFEGDMVKFETLDAKYNSEEVGEIIYRRFGFIAHIHGYGDKQFYDPYVEVIGNIYEHPRCSAFTEFKRKGKGR